MKNPNYSCNKVENDNIDGYVSNNKNKVLNKTNYTHENIQIIKVMTITMLLRS